MTRVLLVISGTRGNRVALREGLASLQLSFPVPGWIAMTALAVGRDPGGGSVILI